MQKKPVFSRIQIEYGWIQFLYIFWIIFPYSSYEDSVNTGEYGAKKTVFTMVLRRVLDQICPRKIFMVKNRKIEHHHWILLIQISLGTKFQLKLTILIFWTKFAQKGYFQSKTEKVNSTTEFCIFKLVLVPNFSLNWQFWFFWPDLPKKGFSGLKQKK